MEAGDDYWACTISANRDLPTESDVAVTHRDAPGQRFSLEEIQAKLLIGEQSFTSAQQESENKGMGPHLPA